MVHVAAWADNEFEMEVLSIGRSVDAKEDCVMELCGRWLAYRIALRGGWVWLSASLMDAICEPRFAVANG
jgi:hypothetical protein